MTAQRSDAGADTGVPSTEGRPGAVARALTWPLEAVVVAYRRVVSPLLPQSCRYYPSCSTYALTALRRFGPLVGTWLAVRRLVRCQPWTPGGVDHVPPRGEHGLPDWATHRETTARREAEWAEAARIDDVRNDDLQDPAPHAPAVDGATGDAADNDTGGGPAATRRGMR